MFHTYKFVFVKWREKRDKVEDMTQPDWMNVQIFFGDSHAYMYIRTLKNYKSSMLG